MSDSLFSPFQNRAYRNLFWADLFSNLGNWLDFTALMVLIAYEWHYGPTETSTLMVAIGIPMVLVGPIVSVWVDRLPLRPLLIACAGLRILLVLGLIWVPNLPLLLGLIFLRSTLSTLFSPARQSAVRYLLQKDQYAQAVTWSQISMFSSQIVAPLIGSALVPILGVRSVFGLVAIVMLLSMTLLLGLPSMPKEQRREKPRFRDDLLQGFSHIRHNRLLTIAMSLVLIGMFLVFLYDGLLVNWSKTLQMNESSYGLLLSLMGAGSVIGALLTGRFHRWKNAPLRLMALVALLGGLLDAVIGLGGSGVLTFTVPVWAVIFMLFGMAGAAATVPYGYILQTETPRELMGRVASVSGSLQSGAMLIAPVFGAWLAAHIGIGGVFLGAGLLLAVLALLTLLFHKRLPATSQHATATPSGQNAHGTPLPNSAKQPLPAWMHAGVAFAIGGTILYAVNTPFGIVPALVPALTPGTGVWTATADALNQPHSETVRLQGLTNSVDISIEADGTPHIRAQSDQDAWTALGYLHAKNRLFQMDLTRRQGTGRLAEVMGERVLESDRFQRQLNLQRTAEAEWNALAPDSELRAVLTAYANGVNQVIRDQTLSNQLPLPFQLSGYHPEPWKPQDTLVIKGVLAQMMSLSMAPITNSLFHQTLGDERADQLFPLHFPNPQSPYDPGPYAKHAMEPFPISAESVLAPTGTASAKGMTVKEGTPLNRAELVTATQGLLDRVAQLPPQAIHQDSNSNAWVVDGTKTASGKPLLAGDPHLDLSLPSVWYQVQVDSPGYQFAGATTPGIPFALIGSNQQIAWSMTNGQNQQTFFYHEKTDPAHPDHYLWNGNWVPIMTTQQEIAVRGKSPVSIEVKSTIHGPLVDREGQTLALNWLGAIPEPDGGLTSLLNLMKAKNHDDFQQAFRHWIAPVMNFVYADRQGNIGVLGAGSYPVFREGTTPWLPMSGTGESDIIGQVPFEDIPQSYNPESHIIVTANQRQVGANYPYYIGSVMDFDPGYRSKRIYDLLAGNRPLTTEDMRNIQLDVTDPIAADLTPLLEQTLQQADLSPHEREVANTLHEWRGEMTSDSKAALVWWMFWYQYTHETFDPWWQQQKVPTKEHPVLKVHPELAGYTPNLHMWTLHEPNNDIFNNPVTGAKRTANDVMIAAFQKSVIELTKQYGSDISNWKYAKLHTRYIPSLLQVPALSYGPKGAEGDGFTIDVANGATSVHGPSWRMVVDLYNGSATASYPGGQSENPLSPWYTDRIQTWWQGDQRPMLTDVTTEIQWKLIP